MEVAPRAPTVDAALVDFEGASPCAQAGLAAWLARVPGEAADRVAWVASAALTDGAADALAQAWSLPREVWLEAAEAAGGAQRARLLRAALGASCEGCAAQAAFPHNRPSEAHDADRLLEGVTLGVLTALDALPAHRSSDDATLARRALGARAGLAERGGARVGDGARCGGSPIAGRQRRPARDRHHRAPPAPPASKRSSRASATKTPTLDSTRGVAHDVRALDAERALHVALDEAMSKREPARPRLGRVGLWRVRTGDPCAMARRGGLARGP